MEGFTINPKQLKQALESRESRFLGFEEEMLFGLQSFFAGFTLLPVEKLEVDGTQILLQHKFLVNITQTLAFDQVEPLPEVLKERSILDKFNEAIVKYKTDPDFTTPLLADRFDEIISEYLELPQDIVNKVQEMAIIILLRFAYLHNRDELLKAVQENRPPELYSLHIRTFHDKNSRDEDCRITDLSFAEDEPGKRQIIESMAKKGYSNAMRKMDDTEIYIYFKPQSEPFIDINKSALFHCYVNKGSFALIPDLALDEAQSEQLYHILDKKGVIQTFKPRKISQKQVSKEVIERKLSTAYFKEEIKEDYSKFSEACEEMGLTFEQRETLLKFILDAMSQSRQNFRKIMAAHMPGYNLEVDDEELAGKINEFTCKIMTGAGRIRKATRKDDKLKYLQKDNNALIQGFSCGRHTEMEVEAIYDFIMAGGCVKEAEDFFYILSVLDHASCGRRNRAYWLKAILQGLMDPKLSNPHKYLKPIMEEEYGKARAAELLSLEPSLLEFAYDKVSKEIQELAEVKFGPVRLGSIVSGIVKFGLGL